MIILGVDPGKTTGLAMIQVEEKKISLLATRESKDTTALDFLDWIQQSDVVVVESFYVRPKKARTGAFDWDQMIAPQVIGSVTTLTKSQGKVLQMQPPGIKPVGYGYSNQKYVKNKKGLHQQDAVAHAVYYAVHRLHALPINNQKPS